MVLRCSVIPIWTDIADKRFGIFFPVAFAIIVPKPLDTVGRIPARPFRLLFVHGSSGFLEKLLVHEGRGTIKFEDLA